MRYAVCPRRRLGQMLRPLMITVGSWQKGRGRGCNAGEVCARRLFLFVCFRLHLEKHRGCTRNAVCMRDDDWEILGVQEARLSWTANDCVLFFFLSTLSDERCSNLSFESPNQNPKNHTLNSHRDTGGTRCVLWEVTRRCMDTYHSRNSAFFPFHCGLFFF